MLIWEFKDNFSSNNKVIRKIQKKEKRCLYVWVSYWKPCQSNGVFFNLGEHKLYSSLWFRRKWTQRWFERPESSKLGGMAVFIKKVSRKMSNLVFAFSAFGLLYSESLFDRLCPVFDPYLIMGDKFQTATDNRFKNASLRNGWFWFKKHLKDAWGGGMGDETTP